MNKYKCICGEDTINYEHHLIIGDIQALSFTCHSCHFGIDRTFVFPPEENEKVLYYTCLNLFRDMGKDHGFTIDSTTLVLIDPLFAVKHAAIELLQQMVLVGITIDKLMELLSELGIKVEHPSENVPDEED